VTGTKPDDKGNLQMVSEIRKAKIFFNDAELPLGVENITNFFPKTTVSLDALGRVLKTNASTVNLPVKLPGLDAKRFPEITYLPIEFTEKPVELMGVWTFKRNFGGSDIIYNCAANKEAKDGVQPMVVTIAQSYETLEDEGSSVVTKPEDAVNRVVTEVNGTGELSYDLQRKLFKSFTVKSVAESTVVSIKSGEKSVRKLNTRISCELVEKK
jgi:hypothetical protein